MTTMQQKNVTGDGSVYFEPVVLKVSGYSQYRPESDVRFEDVPDFWALPEKYHGPSKPPVGTIARFSLKTKPKTGPNAKPGSMYRDIVKIEKADASEYSGAPAAPQAAYKDDYAPQHQQTGSGAPDGMYDQYGKPTRAYWDDQQRQIRLSMAFNNLTVMLANGAFNGAETEKGAETAQAMWDQWWIWYDEAARGVPLSPVDIACACDCGCTNRSSQGQFEDDTCRPCTQNRHTAAEQPEFHDSPLVQAAKDMGATVVDAEDRQELPW